jgi:tRNA A-37 threonylcarbamoyl transferase component Bud32
VLREFAQIDGARRLEIAQIDVGSQAHVFTVQSQARQPVWLTHRRLVIKLYKQDDVHNSAAAIAQRDSLLVLHDAIHDFTVHGWTILVPKPLHVSESPPALIMTMVPGRKLNLCLESGDQFTHEAMDSAARAIAAAMQRCWSARGFHGDLAFHNILCDVQARTLSFVDAGAVTNCCKCDGLVRSWSPAVHDLAHILCDVGSNMKNALVHRAAHVRSQHFSTNLLRACINTIGPVNEKQMMLDELRECSKLHVRAIGSSGAPHGFWHAVTRWIAWRRINAILNRIQADVALPSIRVEGLDAAPGILRVCVLMCEEPAREGHQGKL